MSEKHGTKEIKEAVVALIAIGAFVVSRAKDGVDVADAAALFAKLQDSEFLAVVKNGADGIDGIGQEIKDLSIAEGFELAGEVIPEILKAIQSLK